MANALVTRKPQLRLSDPAEFQHPLSFYAHILGRRWGWILLVSMTLTALVVLACALAPPIYVGSTVIAIDRQAAPAAVGDSRILTTGDDQFMATQQRLLLGDNILRPVAEHFDLLEREHQFRRYYLWHYPPEVENLVRNAPTILKNLKIERNPNTYLITISYRDRDAQMASNVSNAIGDSYLREIFETRIKEAGRLTSSMESQLIDLKEKMESTHNALMTYQRNLGTADPEQKTSVLVARLQALNTENTVAEADRIAKESVYREAKDGTLPEVQVSAQSTDLARDVQNLKQAQANLALVAATYGDQYPEYRKAAAQVEQSRTELEESRQNVAARINVDYRQSLVRQRMLAAAVVETKKEVDDLTAQSFDYLQLKHEADAAEKVYDDLFAKIKQSGINSELENNIIRLADSARPAAKPIFPNWPLIVALSMGFFSLFLSAYVISAELTDNTAKEAETVEKVLGLPVICSLPEVANIQLRLALGAEGAQFVENRWMAVQGGFFDEGIRHLRGYLMLSLQPSPPRSVLITSALPSEGKSTLALSLGAASAEQGKRTLVIDGDLRQPSIAKLARLDPGPGLAEVLAKEVPWKRALRPIPGRPDLFILGSGEATPVALPLIGRQMREILNLANQEFDLVVLDSPPLLGCAETLELAAAAEMTVISVRSGQTQMKSLGMAVDTLRRVNMPIAGIVLNESAIATDATYKAYARYYIQANA
jgi:succinoglycan biosynthesis transport protein ExoP